MTAKLGVPELSVANPQPEAMCIGVMDQSYSRTRSLGAVLHKPNNSKTVEGDLILGPVPLSGLHSDDVWRALFCDHSRFQEDQRVGIISDLESGHRYLAAISS